MTRFVVGDDRSQSTLFPERLDDYLGEDNPVLAVDVFVDELDLAGLGFGGVEPEAPEGQPYHDGNTKPSLRLCKRGWIGTRLRCGSVAKLSSIPSVR